MKQHPYCYPGTNVYRNKLNILDLDELEAAERTISAWRAEQFNGDVEISPDGLREIHRYMLQGVYDWAGQDRTVDTGRTGPFCKAEYIADELDKRFGIINAEDNLRGLDAGTFAERAAEHLSELNAIHPFLDGNGRTLRTFLEVLGEQAGHEVDLTRINAKAWNHASAISFHKADPTLLQEIIAEAVVDREPEKERVLQTPEPLQVIDHETKQTQPLQRYADALVVWDHADLGEDFDKQQAKDALQNMDACYKQGVPFDEKDVEKLPVAMLMDIAFDGDDVLRGIFKAGKLDERIEEAAREAAEAHAAPPLEWEQAPGMEPQQRSALGAVKRSAQMRQETTPAPPEKAAEVPANAPADQRSAEQRRFEELKAQLNRSNDGRAATQAPQPAPASSQLNHGGSANTPAEKVAEAQASKAKEQKSAEQRRLDELMGQLNRPNDGRTGPQNTNSGGRGGKGRP